MAKQLVHNNNNTEEWGVVENKQSPACLEMAATRAVVVVWIECLVVRRELVVSKQKSTDQ